MQVVIQSNLFTQSSLRIAIIVNKVVEQYREDKRRRDRRIRTSQIDTKRKRSRILNEILKTVPYKGKGVDKGTMKYEN